MILVLVARNIWVLSYKSFNIANPASTTGGAGIKSETVEIVKDLTSAPDLVCLFGCIDVGALNTELKQWRWVMEQLLQPMM